MKIFSALWDSTKSAPKKLAQMIFRKSGAFRIFSQPRSGYDFQSAVGDGTGSSTVMAPLLWIARTFPEAPVGLWQTNPEGQEEQLLDTDFLRLMRRPNEFYSGKILMQATIMDRTVDGDAYWLKIRDITGRVRELWWAPTSTITPKGDELNFITHYEYKPGQEKRELPASEVVHFRFGMDSDDPRKGRSPLKSVLREVFTDDEAANFTATLLRNMGVPGLLVSPDTDRSIDPEDAKATKSYIREHFTGDSRGEALVMTGKTKIQQFGFNPAELMLNELRMVPEERVSAVLGVPAIVAGLGAGLKRSTFTNYTEARQAAYEQAIIPPQADMGEDIWHQLLPDFYNQDEIWMLRVGFDYSRVRVLQEDMVKLTNRMAVGVRTSFIKRAEARRAIGLKAGPEDEVYLVPTNNAVVPTDGTDAQIFTPAKGA